MMFSNSVSKRLAMYFHSGIPLPHRAPAEDARADHARVQPVADHRDHRGDQLGRVLVVRVDHDDDVRAVLQRQAIARFLVPAVAEVLHVRVDDRLRQRLRQGGRLVRAGVVDDDDQIDDALRQHLLVRLQQRLGRVVGGHDDDDFLCPMRNMRMTYYRHPRTALLRHSRAGGDIPAGILRSTAAEGSIARAACDFCHCCSATQRLALIEGESPELRVQLRCPRRCENRRPRVAQLIQQVDAAHLDRARAMMLNVRVRSREVLKLAAGDVGVDAVREIDAAIVVDRLHDRQPAQRRALRPARRAGAGVPQAAGPAR